MIDWKEKLTDWLCGNASAIALINSLWAVVETWDDLIDKDKPIGEKEINSAFYLALITLPRNSFYQSNFAMINPLIEAAIFDWQTANEFEVSGDNQRVVLAYGLRFTLVSVIVMAARIINGADWCVKVNAECRSIAEPWSAYSAEHGVR